MTQQKSKELAQEQEQQGRAEYRIQNTDITDTGYLDTAFICTLYNYMNKTIQHDFSIKILLKAHTMW